MYPVSELTAVVLAGGLGERLRTVVEDRPKVLAEVDGRPFLVYVLDQLVSWGIQESVLCTGYLGEQIKSKFGNSFKTVLLRYSQEPSPMGTAGALRFALPLFRSDTVLVLNGDSYCEVDMEGFWGWHCAQKSDATLLLVRNTDTQRYGGVKTDNHGRIIRFTEKEGAAGPGLINAGIYLIKRSLLELISETKPVSLERHIFPSWIGRNFYGYQARGPFLDIGTPESYAAAQAFFAARKPHNE